MSSSSDQANFPRPRLIMMIVLFIVPITGASIDIYVPSLPAIADYFHSPASLAQLTVTTYLLGYAIPQPIFGTLSDCIGRRKVALIGAIIYAISSLLAPFSTSITMILWLRFFQGCAVAAYSAITKAIIVDCFKGKTLAKYTNYMTIAWAMGPIIAPSIGGYLQHYFGWQASFFFLTVYGVIILALAFFLLPETNTNLTRFNLRVFAGHYKAMLTHPVFIGTILCLAAAYGLITVFNVMMPFLVQVVLQQSAITYGYTALLLGLGWLIGNLVNRTLTQRYHVRHITTFSLAAMSGVAAVMVGLSLFTTSLETIIVPSFLLFLGGGIFFPNCFAKCLSLFPHIGGSASAVLGALFILGSALMSGAASFVQAQSQLPLSLFYAALVIVMIVAYRTLVKPALD